MISKADLFHIKDEKDFKTYALDVYSYQYKNNKVYRRWCELTQTKRVEDICDIPFLPVSFFKTHNVTSMEEKEPEDYFLSSGTVNMTRSRHNVYSKQHYIDNTFNCFEQFYGKVYNYCYVCLLPNYMEQSHSSLICMMDAFVGRSIYKQSGFFKDNVKDVIEVLENNESNGIKTVLFGVTYALLDLIAVKKFHFRHTIVFETGGMKGRRKEVAKKELHAILKEGFGVENIASEYGMCELFSQAYAVRNGLFQTPEQMKVLIRPINDPKGECLIERSGIINIIDLANIDTCSFIQTEDVGLKHKDSSFEIIGRLSHSDLRGCNLMYA